MGGLPPGGTLVEATAGNTGLGLALVASQKGYRLILVIPDKMAQEKIFHLRALGAEVRMTRSDVGKGHPEYYQDMAERLAAEIPGAFYVNQFANPANPLAHETGHGAGDLGADGPRCRCGGGGCRLRRHADGRRALLRPGRAQGGDDPGRPQGLGPGAPGEHRQDDRGGLLAGRGDRRGFRAARTAICRWCARPSSSATPKASRPRARC